MDDQAEFQDIIFQAVALRQERIQCVLRLADDRINTASQFIQLALLGGDQPGDFTFDLVQGHLGQGGVHVFLFQAVLTAAKPAAELLPVRLDSQDHAAGGTGEGDWIHAMLACTKHAMWVFITSTMRYLADVVPYEKLGYQTRRLTPFGVSFVMIYPKFVQTGLRGQALGLNIESLGVSHAQDKILGTSPIRAAELDWYSASLASRAGYGCVGFSIIVLLS